MQGTMPTPKTFSAELVNNSSPHNYDVYTKTGNNKCLTSSGTRDQKQQLIASCLIEKISLKSADICANYKAL